MAIGKYLKWIFIFTIIILLLVILTIGGLCLYRATRSVLPDAPQLFTDEHDLYMKISKGILKDGSTVINEEDFNGALDIAKGSINKKMSEEKQDITVNQLFGKINDDKIICYANFTKGKRSFDLTFTAEISYDYPKAHINVLSVTLGKLNIPVDFFMKRISSRSLSDNISVSGKQFIYDTSELNGKLIELIKGNEKVNNVENLITNIFDSFGIKVETEKIVDNFLDNHVEFKITGIKAENSEITIESDLFK